MPKTELEITAEKRAARLGIPIEKLYEHDRESLRRSASEHADCLFPHQFEDDTLRAAVLHVLACPMCASQMMLAEGNHLHSKQDS